MARRANQLARRKTCQGLIVIASEAKRSSVTIPRTGLLRRFAPRNGDYPRLDLLGKWFYSLVRQGGTLFHWHDNTGYPRFAPIRAIVYWAIAAALVCQTLDVKKPTEIGKARIIENIAIKDRTIGIQALRSGIDRGHFFFAD